MLDADGPMHLGLSMEPEGSKKMRSSIHAIVFLLCALAAAACWGEVKDIYPPDGGTGTDTNTNEEPVEPEMFPGGGTGGGPIAGRVNVYVLGEVGGFVLPGAKVMVESSEGILTGETGDTGLAQIDQEGLEGPVDIHVLCDGFVLESLMEVDASNVTMVVRPLSFAPPETVTISGMLNDVDLLPPPEADKHRIVLVRFGIRSKEMLSTRDGRFDPVGPGEDWVLTDTEDHEFELEVLRKPGILYAVGGLVWTYNTPELDDDTIEWFRMGMVKGLDTSGGDPLDNVDLPLDTNLIDNILVDFSQNAVPDAYETTNAYMGLDFSAQGTVWFEYASTGGSFLFAVPLYEGDIGEADILLVGSGGQLVEAGDEDIPGIDMPMAFRFDRGLDNFSGFSLVALPMLPIPSPTLGISWDGNSLDSLPPPAISMGLVVWDDPSGPEFWRLTSVGVLPLSISLPDLPSDWDWSGVPATGVNISIMVSTFETDMNEMLFSDYPEIVDSLAVNEELF